MQASEKEDRRRIMNIRITGHQISLTSSIKRYVRQKFIKINRKCKRQLNFTCVLEVNKLHKKIEVTTHLPGKDIHAEVEDKDMYTAIDLLANKIERQIVKYKEIHMVNMHSTKISD